jgi:AcrR family transcriptional regulator
VSPERAPAGRRTAATAPATDTTEAIVAAAGEVFARHGWEAGTVERIAARAGVSPGTVYERFADKDAILVALVERHLDDASAAFTPLLTDMVTQAPPIADGVCRLLHALVALHRTHPALHRVLFEEAPRPEALRRRLDRTVAAAVEAVHGYLVARPEVRVPDRAVAAQLVVQVAESVTHGLVISPQDGADPDAYVRETERMLVRYLTGR